MSTRNTVLKEEESQVKMTRGNVTLAYIANASYRRESFRKRKKGLIKKVRELSTLCGVDTCAIINSAYDSNPEIWPSQSEAERVLNRFRNLSEVDRTSKMENELSFIRQEIKKLNDRIQRVHKKNKQKEMERLMLEYLESSKHLDLHYTNEMVTVIGQTLEDINSRIDALKKNGQRQPGVTMEGTSS